MRLFVYLTPILIIMQITSDEHRKASPSQALSHLLWQLIVMKLFRNGESAEKALPKLSVSHSFMCQGFDFEYVVLAAGSRATRRPYHKHFSALCYHSGGGLDCGYCWNNPNIYYQLSVRGEWVLLIVGGGVSLSSGRRGGESWRRIRRCGEMRSGQ